MYHIKLLLSAHLIVYTDFDERVFTVVQIRHTKKNVLLVGELCCGGHYFKSW